MMTRVPLRRRFEALYAEDPGFRGIVERLRRMLLDPDEPLDAHAALHLFNEILARFGVEPVSATYITPRKSVHLRLPEPPPPPSCLDAEPPPITVVQPRIDVEAGDGLQEVYACTYARGDRRVHEVTLVFGDEDKPPSGGVLDLWYDLWRLVSWGRVADIETFYIVESPRSYTLLFTGLGLVLGDGGLRRIPPIGSGGHRYYEGAHVYEAHTVPRGPLTVYVNTWNHALGVADNNPALEKVVYGPGDVPAARAPRYQVENRYSQLRYSSETPGV